MNKKNGCLIALFVFIIAITLSLLCNLLVTYLLIWVINGIFNYDLNDKFWFIFVGIVLFNTFLGQFKRNKE